MRIKATDRKTNDGKTRKISPPPPTPPPRARLCRQTVVLLNTGETSTKPLIESFERVAF